MGSEDEISEEILARPEYGSSIVNDPETGCVVLLWIKIHRDTFQKCEYTLLQNSPKELCECLETMKKVIKDKAIITIKLMKEEDILNELGPTKEDERYRRFSAMALCALEQAFEDHLRKRYADTK